MSVYLGNSQAKKTGWISLTQNFNNASSTTDRFIFIANAMKSDTIKIAEGENMIISTLRSINNSDQFLKFKEEYEKFKDDDEIDELKLTFTVNHKPDFSTSKESTNEKKECILWLKKDVVDDAIWAAPIFVNRFTGNIGQGRVLRSADTYMICFGKDWENRGCGCEWCEWVKVDENDGTISIGERSSLPLLQREQMRPISRDKKKTTCYRNLLSAHYLIILMSLVEESNSE